MFGSDVLDVAVGIVFLFLLLSLISSALNELIEGALKNRASNLERGIRELLADPDAKTILRELYNHPLISGLFRGSYDPERKRDLPTYIPARTFALALMDLVLRPTAQARSGAAGAAPAQSDAAGPSGESAASDARESPDERSVTPTPAPASASTTADFRAALTGPAIANVPEPVRRALLTLVDAAGADPAATRRNIEDWYNASMDRVSGWYKRRTQLILFVIGLALAIITNADAIGFARYLSTDKAARALVVSQAQAAVPFPGLASAPPQQAAGTAGRQATPVPKPTHRATSAHQGLVARAAASASPAASVSPAATPARQPAYGVASPAPAELLNSLGWLERHAGIPFGWRAEPDKPEQPSEKQQALYEQQLADYRQDWRKIPEGWGWFGKIGGLLLTAFATTLGAAFWFDVLNKIMVVRSTIKPKEKSPEEPSKA